MDIINEYLQKHKRFEELLLGRKFRLLSPKIECTDGFSMSVQVSETHYCTPRMNDALEYFNVEVGFPSAEEELLMPYAEEEANPTGTVYGWTPVEVVNSVIEKHGGIKE